MPPDYYPSRSGLAGMTGLVDSAETWIAVAYVVCMFLVVAFRSQQIGGPAFFRWSYVAFLCYFIVPSVVTGVMWMLSILTSNSGGLGGLGARNGDNLFTIVLFLLTLLDKVLLGVSIFLGLASMRIPPATRMPPGSGMPPSTGIPPATRMPPVT